jgi:hypothetical protein
MSSLPVPDSPVISTAVLVFARARIRAMRSRIARLRPRRQQRLSPAGSKGLALARGSEGPQAWTAPGSARRSLQVSP